jgi:hypothetical protein
VDIPVIGPNTGDFYAIISHGSLLTQCALEIFSGFIEGLASYIHSRLKVQESLATLHGGNSEVREDRVHSLREKASISASPITENPDNRSVSLRQKLIERDWRQNIDEWEKLLLSMSQILVNYDIVDDIEKAYPIVFTPFIRHDLMKIPVALFLNLESVYVDNPERWTFPDNSEYSTSSTSESENVEEDAQEDAQEHDQDDDLEDDRRRRRMVRRLLRDARVAQ